MVRMTKCHWCATKITVRGTSRWKCSCSDALKPVCWRCKETNGTKHQTDPRPSFFGFYHDWQNTYESA